MKFSSINSNVNKYITVLTFNPFNDTFATKIHLENNFLVATKAI